MSELKQKPQQLVIAGLNTAVVGRNIFHFDAIGSTNAAARRYAEQGATEGTVVLADYQTGGRGRLGRSWTAPPRSSLLCSILLYPEIEPEYLFSLTMLASVAVVDALRQVAGIDCGVKWPNDVYAGGKKICGILTEVECDSGKVRYAVIGIGLNVNWTVKGTELEKLATSVSDITGRDAPVDLLLAELLRQFDSRYAGSRSPEAVRSQWLERCMHLGRQVRVLEDGPPLTGIARGITAQGHLLLETAGEMREVLCGDVSLRW